MMLVNLLPHREERRKRRKQAFFAGLGLAAVAGLAVVGLWYLVLEQMISSQQDRNTYLTAEIKKLEEQIKDVATLKAEIEALKARQKAVEDLQTDRNMPVNLLNELVKQTPEGVYLTAIKQDNQNITVTGIAQTNERVSEFLRNTAYNSPWIERPELVEIQATTVNTGRDQKRLFGFSVRLNLKRPQDVADAASAPGQAPKSATAASSPVPAAAASAPKQS